MKSVSLLVAGWLFLSTISFGQTKGRDGNLLAPTPPMGWMTWNYYADNLQEDSLKSIADAMVNSGMLKAGYTYLFIDDGWQGGRDNRNNIIPDPTKFPSGIKALADYVHSKGLKLGIYSDAAPLTCAGYTASLHFEQQDAKTFAAWGVDYLKYDYCGAPPDSATAKLRYKAIADALRKSGRDIVLSVCEWGDRQPWNWAASVGGQLWRTTPDLRDKWKSTKPYTKQEDLHRLGAGILDVAEINSKLGAYSGPGHWNDLDMLEVGLYGKRGPSGDLGGVGCSNVEYQSQMSLWCMLNSALAASNDIRNMNAETKRILLNEEIIAINQDALGIQATMKSRNDTLNIYVKPLLNGDYAVAILNKSETPQVVSIPFSTIGLEGKFQVRDVWSHKDLGSSKLWKGTVQPHETMVFRLRFL